MKIVRLTLIMLLALNCLGRSTASVSAAEPPGPNIVLIYADDLGYGDLSCYGATKIQTPNIDRLAAHGLRFTNGHAAAATCTPSRYALLTGEYAWRQAGTAILPGDASLIIRPGRVTLPSTLQQAGYVTGAVGKWHLGLGEAGRPLDWNGTITPGPSEIGFNYSFLIPATLDRVPCVYVENQRVVGLEPSDPIEVSYLRKVGREPTGRENSALLTMGLSEGHDGTIVNGISRIGFMSGGKSARWTDEDIADTLTRKAARFIEQHRTDRFFLYFATADIHVPRVPHPRFAGRSGMGPRGDVILQLDWCVGEIMKTLERLNLADNTLVIFSSDNGPVIDDGYRDFAVEKLGGHTPAGPLRGGKYSAFDAGTRVPLIVHWPARVKPGTSGALVGQTDFLASLAHLTGRPLAHADAPDSCDILPALLGESATGLDHLVEHANALSIIQGHWKFIEPKAGPRINRGTNTELGNDPQPQLYDLSKDIGEKDNVASQNPKETAALAALLGQIRTNGRSRN